MGDTPRTSGSLEHGRSSSQELSAYYLGLETLLARIEQSNTHYEVLGLSRTAAGDEIKSAYRAVVGELTPPASWVSTGIPGPTQQRITKALDRITQALTVLSNFGKRVDYDNSLSRKINKPLPLPIQIPEFPKSRANNAAKSSVVEPAANDQPGGKTVLEREEVVRAYGISEMGKDERRRCERFRLRIPARITSYDPGGAKWTEVAETVDVARLGLGVRIRRNIRFGTIVHLMVPMPLKLRTHGYSDPGYSVFALVRRVEPQDDGTRIVGLEFLGEHPPAGYLEKPWAVFRTRQWTGSERRRGEREPRTETVVLHYLDNSQEVIRKETARTENLSSRGARILVKSAPQDIERVRVTSGEYKFESLAVIRNRYIGTDSVERLCLRFLDCEWPD